MRYRVSERHIRTGKEERSFSLKYPSSSTYSETNSGHPYRLSVGNTFRYSFPKEIFATLSNLIEFHCLEFLSKNEIRRLNFKLEFLYYY